MPRVNDWMRGRANSAAHFEPRGPFLAWGRTLLGLATLTVILFTPDHALFPYPEGVPGGTRCDGARAVSLWCLAGPGESSLWTARILAAVTLSLVVAGYRPRWTCLPHYYVAFSLSATSAVVNGGDKFSQTAAMLLVPLCLGDGRRWHWQRVGRPLSPAWRGSAYAAILVIRAQLFITYAGAALAKILDPAWRHGDALFIIPYGADFGLARPVLETLDPLLHSSALVAALGWTVIAVEFFIAVGVLGPRASRLAALAAATGLHLAIMLGLGLISFGMAMIAFVAIACCPTGRAGASPSGEPLRRNESMAT